MRILIDGYNLLFQSPLVGRGRGPGWLDRARKRLISHLHSHLSLDLLQKTCLVFDASRVGVTESDFHTERGIAVVFSTQHPEADDLLEELIRKHTSPKSLLVVSSDHRIRQCANARRARPSTSEQFLRDLQESRFKVDDNISSDPAVDLKSHATSEETLTEEQINFWLKEFGQQ